MSNNYWQSQNNQNGPAGPGGPPKKSGLLSNYKGQGPSSTASPVPVNSPAPQGSPSSSPLPPPAPYQGNQPAPGPQGGPSFAPARPPSQQLPPMQQQGNGLGNFMARPMQMVQRISSKMGALRRPAPNVDPNPMVRYRGPQPPAPPAVRPVPTKTEPWRRSRVQRITHLIKRRRERFLRNAPGSKRISIAILSSIAGLLLILISSLVGYAYNFYEAELPKLQNLANSQIAQTTRIYDRHGTLLNTLYDNTTWGLGGRSTPISYYDLPGVLQDAQIAAEDPSFWTNNGIDPQGTLRALTEYFSHGGQVAGGGSTLTQQLIKNLSHNNDDRSFQNKASEAALAVALTQQYSKKKVLEMYFNDSPYGSQESGVEAAVEDYFGLKPQCNTKHQCVPAIQFLDRDLSQCTVTKPQIDETSCAVDPILALTRAAMLAGIPQNPTSFDPSTDPQNLVNLLKYRLPYVLDQMHLDGMSINLGLGDKDDIRQSITDDIISQVEAKAATLKIVGFHQTMLAPHFTQWVITTLSNQLGKGDPVVGLQILKTSGLNIYTTLDLNLEQFIEKDIKHNLRDRVLQVYPVSYGPLNTVFNVNDSAAVVMNAKTGEVLAMVGSADYNDTKGNDPQSYKQVAGQYNAATAYRQPGSTMKPFVYATAFMEGWYPGIRMIDSKTIFPTAGGGTYTPHDYLNANNSKILEDIRLSLANSYNIPAVKALMYAGLGNVVNTLRRAGITAVDTDLWRLQQKYPGETLEQAFGAALALGAAEVPLIQMVDAYQTFADNGLHIPYHNILDIYDNYGNNLAHYDPTKPNASRVFSQQISFLITNMISDDYARRYEFAGIHTLTMYNWNNQPVAAKTGTTDDFKDNWTLGYTTNLVVGVWSGNADNKPMANNVIGITGAGPIWNDIIEYASGRPMLGMHTDLNLPPGNFPTPGGVVQSTFNTYNGLKGSGFTDWIIDGQQPQQSGLPPCTTDPTGNGNGGNGPGNGGNGNGKGPGTGTGGTPTNCTPANGTGNGNSTPLDPLGGEDWGFHLNA
ncbi:MAG TPA: transglycosylase domain-containing protein [Ktedonobacteraceae bacterium]